MSISNKTLEISAIIPTYNRSSVLKKTLSIVAEQTVQFKEIIIVDASTNDETFLLYETGYLNMSNTVVQYHKATEKGAAIQRNQGITHASQPFICFMDDDIFMEPFCLERLWNCLQLNKNIGGVNAMVMNQQYHAPGKLTKLMCRITSGKNLSSYAGKCIGPAWNFLPEDNDNLPDCVPIDWLNTTCVIYRRDALPMPVFSSHFTGYSLMEDLTLSLSVGKKWKLYNARTARIYHDSQPADYKSSVKVLEKMELINRHYVMTKILGKKKFTDYLKLFLLEIFFVFSLFQSKQGLKKIPQAIWGKLLALKYLVLHV